VYRVISSNLPDISGAVYEFVLWAGVDSGGVPLDPENIFRAHMNFASLPCDKTDCAIIQFPAVAKRRSTNAECFKGDDEIELIRSHWEVEVLVNIFGTEIETARERAIGLVTIAETEYGGNFFQERQVRLDSTTGPVDIGNVLDTGNYVRGFGIRLNLAFNAVVEMELLGTDKVTVSRLENVDVHHPPIGG
jgi:hypothetical protein